jgi:hypothetical protein
VFCAPVGSFGKPARHRKEQRENDQRESPHLVLCATRSSIQLTEKQNVFLLGGFAGSPSLITALRMALKEYAAKENITQIRLIEDTNKK